MDVDYVLKQFRELGVQLRTKQAEQLTEVHKTFFDQIMGKLKKHLVKEKSVELPKVMVTRKTANSLYYIWKSAKESSGTIEAGERYIVEIRGASLFGIYQLSQQMYDLLEEG